MPTTNNIAWFLLIYRGAIYTGDTSVTSKNLSPNEGVILFLLNHNFFKPIKFNLSFLFSISFLFYFVFFALLVSPNIVQGFDSGFAWDANTEPDLAGYYIYYKTDVSGAPYNGTGADEGNSPIQIPITSLSDPANPVFTIHGLSDTETYFFVITAYDTAGNEGGFSNELTSQLSSTPGNTPPEVTITAPANDSSFNLGDSITFTGSAHR